MLRIVRDLTAEDPVVTLDEVRPRLDCAQAWVTEYVPPQERTQVREEPDHTRLAALSDAERGTIKLLVEGMAANWSLDGLTTLLYGIPKLQLGLPQDHRAADAQDQGAPARLGSSCSTSADREGHRPAAADSAAGPLGQDRFRYLRRANAQCLNAQGLAEQAVRDSRA